MLSDLSLFSEFERNREAEGSFIHYDENSSRSKIIFESYESEEDAESDVDSDERASKMSDSGNKSATVETEYEKEEEVDNKQEDAVSNSSPVSNKGSELNGDSTKSTSAQNDMQEKERAWLNEQLYAEAAEEAKKSNASTNQLIFERNKYRRYCKILDSTRMVPDEDSPPVQLLFHNAPFARKYRQQIEQFIKGLLWDDIHRSPSSQETHQEVTVKPGAPSCVDINSKLTAEQKQEIMRQRHAFIGSCQFHNKFLIDFLGWPFSLTEPARCNINWEVPLYSQIFNEVYADPSNKTKAQKKSKPSCWNCGTENHSVAECRLARNPARIAANRKEFLEQQSQNSSGPKFPGAKRYHLDPHIASKFAKFQAGHVSESLSEALGLRDDQLPQHIYKMRLYGYPPGWLAQAKQIQSSVAIFDKHGSVTLITGERLEDGELDEGKDPSSEYDINKIIEYPGFTVPVPAGFVDEHSNFQMPPIQQHQLKKTLMKQSTDKKASAKKRKREAAEEEKKDAEAAKKAKLNEEGEDGEIEDKDGQDQTEESQFDELDPSETPAKNDESIPCMNSISRDFGTPILMREMSNLPDASKFGVGIEDHIPYENLPDATGTFEKMKGLIDLIRKKRNESL